MRCKRRKPYSKPTALETPRSGAKVVALAHSADVTVDYMFVDVSMDHPNPNSLVVLTENNI